MAKSVLSKSINDLMICYNLQKKYSRKFLACINNMLITLIKRVGIPCNRLDSEYIYCVQ